MGPFENGVYARDSLHFEITSDDYSAHFDHAQDGHGDQGLGHEQWAELRFVSADTTRPAPAPVDLASPLAGRWDGVLLGPERRTVPCVLICHPHTDQVLDGYLYIYRHGHGAVRAGCLGRRLAPTSGSQLRRYSAHFDGTTMIMERSGRGMEPVDPTSVASAPTPRQPVELDGGTE